MLIFFFGSNNVKQLKARLALSNIKTQKAHLEDHSLIFSQFSNSWGGSVASIYPNKEKTVHGYIADIPYTKVKLLDNYEGEWYSRVQKIVITEVITKNIKKIVNMNVMMYEMKNEYISDYKEPSEEYMTAIFATINLYWKEIVQIDIHKIKNNKIIKFKTWSIYLNSYHLHQKIILYYQIMNQYIFKYIY